jgi:hypothetical protein
MFAGTAHRGISQVEPDDHLLSQRVVLSHVPYVVRRDLLAAST